VSSLEQRYTLEVPLGESALGTVWTAKDRESGQSVVVMHLDEDADDAARARFRDHATKLLTIDHPNVVRGIDQGDTSEGVPYLAVE
jgi:serine/threonine protein kinase